MASQYPLTVAQAKRLVKQQNGRLPLPGYEAVVTHYPVKVQIEGSMGGPASHPLLQTWSPARTEIWQATLYLQNNAGYFQLREDARPTR